MSDTQNFEDIDDDDVLESMINQTNDEELKRKIRRRQKNIREKRSAAFEAQRQARLQQSGGEDSMTARLRKAEEDKQKKLRAFDEQARAPKQDGLGVAEEALRLRQANADAMKQQRLEQMKEMGKVNSAAYNTGVSDVLKKKDAENSINSTTIVDDKGTRTTTTTSTNQSMNRGAGGTQYTVKTVQTTTTKTSGGLGAAPAAGAARGGMVQRNPSAIKQMLLDWCKAQTAGYEGVNVTNFSSSWNDGLAFCALIHKFYPNAFDFSKLNAKCRRGNFTLAFDVAEKLADIAPLLEVEDMVRMKNPDWKCVFTYVQSFYRRFAMQKNQQPSSPTEANAVTVE